MISPAQCPTDFITINENQVRLTAAGIFILALLYLFTGYWPIILFLLIDFTLRALNKGKLSPLNLLSGLLVKTFNIKFKPTDRAPKRFAALLGLVITAIALLLVYIKASDIAFPLIIALAFFSFLESVFSFCTGCYIYSILLKLKG